MKKLAKYWPAIYAILIAIYEAYAFVSNSDLLPVWVKSVVGILALIGLIAKNYTPENKTSDNPND